MKPRRLSDSFDPDKTSFHSLKTKIINDRRLSKLRRPKTSGIEIPHLARTLPRESDDPPYYSQERKQAKTEYRILNLNLNSCEEFFETAMNFETTKISMEISQNREDSNGQANNQVKTEYQFSELQNLHNCIDTENFPRNKDFRNCEHLKTFIVTAKTRSNLNLDSFEESFKTMKTFQSLKTFEDELPPSEPPPAEPPPEPPPQVFVTAQTSVHSLRLPFIIKSIESFKLGNAENL